MMSKKTMKLMALVLALVMMLSLAGCVNSGTNPSTNGTDGSDPTGGTTGTPAEKVYTYNTYLTLSPSNWNELTYQDSNDTNIMSYIGSAFFGYDYARDEAGQIISGAYEVTYEAATKLEDVTAQYAEAWGVPADGKGYAYKITLRQDLKWENGDPIKAEDFVYTMQEQLNPLFQNYRADSFYVGATVIVGAKDYAKQGQSGWFAASEAYSVYSEDMDGALIWNLGPATEEHNAVSYFSNWLASNYLGDGATLEDAASFISANFGIAVDTLVAMEGKTFAEIKADPAMKAAWDTLITWWQTEPNEELHFFVAEYTFPEVSFDTVGIFVGDNEYELVVVLEKPLDLLNEDGSLSYKAAYNFSSLPLVHKATYEQCKIAPSEGTDLWTTNYNTSVATTMSWGAYKLESFQAGKQYVLVKNDEWYGFNDAENEGLYQTDRIVCDIVEDWNAAWVLFQAGKLDGIGIDVSIADDYKSSDRAYYTPDDYVGSLQLQSNVEALKSREEEGINKTILSYVDFRNALSLAIDRADFAVKCTTSSKQGFGLYNSMHYYDVANGGVFRDTDEAKQVLCDVYGVDVSKYPSLDAAYESITGYNLELARQKLTAAYNAALAAGDIKETDTVLLTFGTGSITEAVTRQFDYIKEAWQKLAEGTPLEGRIDLELKDIGTTWANDFRAGSYDVCMGGWSGAAWDPGYFLLAYLSPDYMYSAAWDTSSAMMTFTMKGVGENGEDITETMSLMDWYDCLNGAGKYDWSSNGLEESQRLQLIAALEKEVLSVYYTVPLYNYFGASMLSYQVDYVTYEYNTFLGYGGIKYMTYNFDDAAWEAEVDAQNGELNYK